MPGTVELDAGTIAGDAVGPQEIAVAHTFKGGWYWLGGVIQNAPGVQPTVRIGSGNTIPLGFPMLFSTALPGAGLTVNGYGLAPVNGALPPFTGSNISSSMPPRLWFRF